MRTKGSTEDLAARRRKGLALVDSGESFNEVGRRLDIAPSTVMRWYNQRCREGEAVFDVHSPPGRPPRLNPKQKKKLNGILLRGALASGYRTELWTTKRVAEVIEKVFGVTYDSDHVGRILHGMGFSCQKPDRRALERDEARIAHWKHAEWPRIKKTPRTWARTSSS